MVGEWQRVDVSYVEKLLDSIEESMEIDYDVVIVDSNHLI